MKLLEKAFVRYLFAICAAMAAACTASAAPNIVYLKADATGDGSGQSWANACTDIAAAVGKLATGSEDRQVVFAAQGVYVVNATITAVKNFELYGGFKGDETGTEEKMLAARDWDEYQTIFTGDQGGDDVWVHIVPDKNDLSAPAYIPTDEPVIKGGKVNLPAYTGDYDAYVISLPGKGANTANTTQNFAVPSARGTVVIDGIWSLSFYYSDRAGFLTDSQLTGDTTSLSVRNCRMVGHRGNNGIYYGYSNRQLNAFSNCKVINTVQASSMPCYGSCQFSGCEFVGVVSMAANSEKGTGGTGVGSHYWFGNNNRMTGCSWTRTICYSSNGTALLQVPATYEDLTMTNCFAVSTHSDGKPIVSFGANQTLSHMTNCCFRGNFVANTGAVAGRTYALVRSTGGTGYSYVGVESCVFEENELVVTPSAATSEGEYAAGVAAHAYNASRPFMFHDCSFLRNKVSAGSTATLTGYASDAVVQVGITTATTPELGLANCTILSCGVAGAYSFVQIGANLALNNMTAKIVDCLFMSEADQPSPFRLTAPQLVTLQNCSVKNVIVPPTGLADATGWDSDEVPLERFTFVRRGVLQSAYRIAALPSGARVASDIYAGGYGYYGGNYNVYAGARKFYFRTVGETKWTYFFPNYVENYAKSLPVVPTEDAEDVTRVFGAYNRGAVQTPTELATTGNTLVLRRDPLTGGAFTGPAVQAVAAGTAPQQVTVVPAAGRSFDGWYDENGDKVSDQATLTIDSLDDDRVLTARFAAPKVKLTFELGDYATYVESGSRTYEVELQPGATFSAQDIPDYAANKGWHLLGWDKPLPQQVPDEATTWTMTGVTTDLRVIRVVPSEEAGETQDGTTWETAYGSISAAYADAAKYRGEVWVKKGEYVVSSQIVPRSNVSVYGGFEGAEDEREAADPADNESLVIGATAYLFYTSEPVTNVVYAGLTVSNFTAAAFRFGADAKSEVSFDACRVKKCGTAASLGNADLKMSNCELTLNTHALASSASASVGGSVKTVLTDCLFADCTAGGRLAVAGVELSGSMTSYLTNCTFRGNYAYGDYGTKGGDAALSLSGMGVCEVVDCAFVSNRTARNAANVVGVGSSARFERCLFDGNRVEGREAVVGGNISDGARSAGVGVSGGSVVLNGCLFRGQVLDANVVAREQGAYVNGPNVVWSAIGAVAGGSLTLLNCTVEGTFVACNPIDFDKGNVTVGALVRASGNLALVNTQILGSTITNLYSAQIACRGGTGTFAALNSIVGEASVSDGATAWRTNGSTQVYAAFANSHLHGIDLADFETAANRAYAFDMAAEPPHYGSARRVDPATGFAMPVVQGPAPYLRGRGVYLKDNAVWFRDEVTNPAKPWRKAVDRTVFEADGAAAAPQLADGQVSDAFGAVRRGRHCTLGPLVGPPLGLTLLVR